MSSGNAWTSATELRAFLRSRRAAVTLEKARVPPFGRRRVPGLRREELAGLVGIRVTCHTRLEQAESHQISDSVHAALPAVQDPQHPGQGTAPALRDRVSVRAGAVAGTSGCPVPLSHPLQRS